MQACNETCNDIGTHGKHVCMGDRLTCDEQMHLVRLLIFHTRLQTQLFLPGLPSLQLRLAALPTLAAPRHLTRAISNSIFSAWTMVAADGHDKIMRFMAALFALAREVPVVYKHVHAQGNCSPC